MIQDIYTNNSWAQQSFMSDVIHERIARVFLQGRPEYLASIIGSAQFYGYLTNIATEMLIVTADSLRELGTSFTLTTESSILDEPGTFHYNQETGMVTLGGDWSEFPSMKWNNRNATLTASGQFFFMTVETVFTR